MVTETLVHIGCYNEMKSCQWQIINVTRGGTKMAGVMIRKLFFPRRVTRSGMFYVSMLADSFWIKWVWWLLKYVMLVGDWSCQRSVVYRRRYTTLFWGSFRVDIPHFFEARSQMYAESSLNQRLALDFSSSAAAHSASCCPGASLIWRNCCVSFQQIWQLRKRIFRSSSWRWCSSVHVTQRSSQRKISTPRSMRRASMLLWNFLRPGERARQTYPCSKAASTNDNHKW